jgi:uncharacterized phosphosugar-binding protein
MFEYVERISQHLRDLAATQQEQIKTAAEWFAETITHEHIIHAFGTGHSQMVAMELFTRASGLANVNTILDDLVLSVSGARRGAAIERVSGLADIVWSKYDIRPADVLLIVSNSGRNAMPIEMAMRAKQEGVKTIAITSLTQSKQYPSRHGSGQKLYELADLVVDNGVPSGDGLMQVGSHLTGPVSSMAGILLVNTIATEAMKLAAAQGAPLPIYHSQNVDGPSNEELYTKYESRIKHL